MTAMPCYRPALAHVHHEGFGGHGDACAPGILGKLRPVRERGGVVLELGCGSGALTRHLVAAGHRVIATDASHVPHRHDSVGRRGLVVGQGKQPERALRTNVVMSRA